MVKDTLTGKNIFAEEYREYTDKYFLRSKQILEAEDLNPIVRYQVFVRKNIESLRGVDETIEFIQKASKNKARIYSLKNGQSYSAGEPLMKIEGNIQDLIDLETGYLEILSGRLTGDINLQEVKQKAKAVVQVAKEKPVYYFGARHFAPELDRKIAKICYEEGFAGCSTDIGAKAWNAKGIGTIPHALILSYSACMNQNGTKGNPTVESAKAFDKNMDQNIPRIFLIDTFNREIEDTIATAKAIPNLAGVRIDTCGENYAQGSKEVELPKLNVDPKYLRGKGVTIASVWALRRAVDKEGFGNLKITVSSGFNANKTAAFMKADRVYQELYDKPLFDSIGTGSLAKPTMTTSDIVAYFNQNKKEWVSLSKIGRGEVFTKRLEERI